MKKFNRKGFTLIELLAVVVLLAIIMGVGSYAILGIINGTREKNYEMLIDEIHNAVLTYYQECRYVDNDCVYEITLGTLVNEGYLKGNDEDDSMKLVNPNDNGDITNCAIKFEYLDGDVTIKDNTANGVCPSNEDYANYSK